MIICDIEAFLKRRDIYISFFYFPKKEFIFLPLATFKTSFLIEDSPSVKCALIARCFLFKDPLVEEKKNI